MILLNGVGCICWFLFYHPPTFVMLQHGHSAKELVLGFDYVGFVLFSGGITLLILGLSWGGTLYGTYSRSYALYSLRSGPSNLAIDWDSAHIICTLTIGGVLLILFWLYELLAKPKEPYIPMKLFRRRGYNAAVLSVSVVAMGYYGFR